MSSVPEINEREATIPPVEASGWVVDAGLGVKFTKGLVGLVGGFDKPWV